MHRFQNCFRFLSTTFCYGVMFYVCHAHTGIKCFWSIVLKRVKVKWQCRGFFFKIEHGLFRVIGLKLAGEPQGVFDLISFSLLPFILPP